MAELDDKVIVTKDKITTIADTIREEGGTSDLMTLDEMPDNIRAIGGGGYYTGVDPIQIDANGNISCPKLVTNIGNYNVSDYFELGNISVSNSGWSYSVSYTRVRTKNGLTLKIKAGTKIGLSDYTNARYYVSWKNSLNQYDSRGWLTTDFTTIEDGDYVILITSVPEDTETSEVNLASLFFGFNGCMYDEIHQNSILKDYKYKTFSGYIDASGGVAPDDGTSKVVYSEFIPVWNGASFTFQVNYGEIKNGWIAYALYDEEKNFISRTVLFAGYPMVSQNFNITISNTNAKFMVLTYRTYDVVVAKLTTVEITKIINTNVNELKEFTDNLCSLINTNINSVNHRGYNRIAPENTLPAFKLSKQKGFSTVETDVQFTSDGVAVCLHDSTINRTARNSDGTAISNTINISDITYDEALTYDFGIWKAPIYAETKIPTFEEFLKLCKNLGLKAYVELKDGTEAQIKGLIDIVKKCGMIENITWISFSSTYLSYIKDVNSKVRLGQIVNTLNQTILDTVLALKTSDNEVFINHQVEYLTNEIIQMCYNADISLEVWLANTISSILNMDSYVTGISSDYLIAGYELYKANI